MTSHVEVTCQTCHRGVSRPMPLEQVIQETATSAGADSAVRAYRALRERYYGRASYDFGEPTLDAAAFRLARREITMRHLRSCDSTRSNSRIVEPRDVRATST